MNIGPYGIWTFNLDLVPSARSIELVAELEELGFGAVWIPEAVGREPFTSAAILLQAGTRIVVATGVATIYSRDAMAAAAAQRTLLEAYPDRFLLGLGVSHQPMVEAIRGHEYDKPYTAMSEYLDRMDTAIFMAAQPASPPERVLAALRPRMLRLAAEKANGALPYFVPPEHTAFARETMGDGPLLAVEQAVVFETEPTRAREIARQHTVTYTGLPNYTGNLRRFGFDDEDFVPGGSDRLVDAIVAWGNMDTVLERVQAHRDAGADHVCLQVIQPDAKPPIEAWRLLAEAL